MSDSKTLSILIPVYNYNVTELVRSLSSQAHQLNIPFEILCYDDGSCQKSILSINQSIANYKGVVYKQLPQNLGRSKIRNKLALEAQYNYLLFIDCDSSIVSKEFLKNYLSIEDIYKVVFGGTVYTQAFNPEFSLRLIYGKEREQKRAAYRSRLPYQYSNLNNLFIHRETYLSNKLDEEIITYGHEDTKFGYRLKENGVSVMHIDNPVEHSGLENNEIFISKTKEGIKNFYKITLEGYGHETKLFRTYKLLNKFRLKPLFNFFYQILSSSIHKSLRSSNPSLFYFDLFKLKIFLDHELKDKSI